MIQPRRFWRPQEGVDVPALLSGAAFLSAVVGACLAGTDHWASLFPGARAVVPSILLTAPLWRSEGRRLAWFFWWSAVGRWTQRREARAEVIGSEAVREIVHDDDESSLSPRARYGVRLWTEDGSCLDCELPRRRWARLRVGAVVRVVWRGGWIVELVEVDGALGPEP